LLIHPFFSITEGYIFSAKTFEKKSWYRTNLKNLFRWIVLVSAILLTLVVKDKLDKLMGITGALFCAPIAFTMPAMIHHKLVAKTSGEKLTDKCIIAFSIVILIFSTYRSIAAY
jgi:amino acid permease